MLEPPWLTAQGLDTAERILAGHLAAFGRPLLAGVVSPRDRRQAAQELFGASRQVLAHDAGSDPRLIYVNGAALQLWGFDWAAMVGRPSRLTAEPQERASRAQALARARELTAISNYSGVRVDRDGRRFQIDRARVWSLLDRDGHPCGQAASFAHWWWLS
jgi:hypothetical protein